MQKQMRQCCSGAPEESEYTVQDWKFQLPPIMSVEGSELFVSILPAGRRPGMLCVFMCSPVPACACAKPASHGQATSQHETGAIMQ